MAIERNSINNCFYNIPFHVTLSFLQPISPRLFKFWYYKFYAECNLSTTEIDSISGNLIYLNSSLAVPDTGNIWKVLYSIKIKDNQIGKIEIKETDYVGM